MSDKMVPIPFTKLLHWIWDEYQNDSSIFGFHKSQFFKSKNRTPFSLLNEAIDTPLGPAAGPHTQMTQNLVVAWLAGGRFFELKTVQKLDELEVDKPCIDARDEGYNVEWSQELKLDQSYEEYIKTWFILHLLNDIFELSPAAQRMFIFNMSVGYDLAGIKTERMDRFINELKDASHSQIFQDCSRIVHEEIAAGRTGDFLRSHLKWDDRAVRELLARTDGISPLVSCSVTLSTMHGCPPAEIESISTYLMKEKNLHTYVKLNPTLLGFEKVKEILGRLGYRHIELDPVSFSHDLQYSDAVPMLKRLMEFAGKHQRQFGVKLSNTLGVFNRDDVLKGDQKYMSGRALFPLTITLASILTSEFDGTLKISYSGGAGANNISQILECGIYPVTMATDLLKPGGYGRLRRMSDIAAKTKIKKTKNREADPQRLQNLADSALTDKVYHRDFREITSVKGKSSLPKFDCYMAPCQQACPIHQDIADYIQLVELELYPEAFETIIQRNPLPHITGHICTHECMSGCTRWDYDQPVHIRDMKKEAAEKGYALYLKNFKKNHRRRSNGKKVAVIGAGPSGLSAGYFLARAGFDVTILDKEKQSGGVVQNVIPDFRLPQSAIDKDIEFIKEHGISVINGINPDFSIEKLQSDGFSYIYLAIGAEKSRLLSLEEENGQVLEAISFLRSYRNKENISLGKRVAVIGGGNSAMDGARAARRCKGVETIYIIYRRTKEFMPADMEEFDAAMEEGVIFRELLLPVSFSGKELTCQLMELGDPEADGRRRVVPVKNRFEIIAVDSVISAIGESLDPQIIRKNGLITDDRLTVNEKTLETARSDVFIGGDARRGPSSVVEAIADGRQAAESICYREKIKLPPAFVSDRLPDASRREKSIVGRKGIIAFPAHGEQEASRCLGCSFLCNKCVDVCPNRANVAIRLKDKHLYNRYQILHIHSLCNECGNCETFCPHDGAPFKDKVTIFHSEQDFLESTNDGFILENVNSPQKINFNFKIRYKNQIAFVTYHIPEKKIFSSLMHQGEEYDIFTRLITRVIDHYRYLVS